MLVHSHVLFMVLIDPAIDKHTCSNDVYNRIEIIPLDPTAFHCGVLVDKIVSQTVTVTVSQTALPLVISANFSVLHTSAACRDANCDVNHILKWAKVKQST